MIMGQTRKALHQSAHDCEYVVITVAYDEIAEGFICAYCLSEMGGSMSTLHETYGGDILPKRMRTTHKTLAKLRHVKCLVCDLPACRAYDH